MKRLLLYSFLFLEIASGQLCTADSTVRLQSNNTSVCISDKQHSWITSTLEQSYKSYESAFALLTVPMILGTLITGLFPITALAMDPPRPSILLASILLSSSLTALFQATIPISYNYDDASEENWIGFRRTRDELGKMVDTIKQATTICPLSPQNSTVGYCIKEENALAVTESLVQYRDSIDDYFRFNFKAAVIGAPIIGFLNILYGFFAHELCTHHLTMLPITTDQVVPGDGNRARRLMFTGRLLVLFNVIASWIIYGFQIFHYRDYHENSDVSQAQVDKNFKQCQVP